MTAEDRGTVAGNCVLISFGSRGKNKAKKETESWQVEIRHVSNSYYINESCDDALGEKKKTSLQERWHCCCLDHYSSHMGSACWCGAVLMFDIEDLTSQLGKILTNGMSRFEQIAAENKKMSRYLAYYCITLHITNKILLDMPIVCLFDES